MHVFASHEVQRPGLVIANNVLTRCINAAGIVADTGVQLLAGGHNNNIWLTGKGGGLKELNGASGYPRDGALQNYYAGINQSSTFRTHNVPDFHTDPEIVSFDEDSVGFLCVAAGSPSANASIGPCIAEMPESPLLARATWQGVVNSDFSAGMWGWQGEFTAFFTISFVHCVSLSVFWLALECWPLL